MGKRGISDDNKIRSILTSQRWIMGYIGFFVQVMNACFRVNISMAIVCMVKSSETLETAYAGGNFTFSSNQSEADDNGINEAGCTEIKADQEFRTPEFDWDKTTQSWLLSAYFYGYMVMQIPGGLLATKFGGKIVITVGLLIPSVGCLLTPSLTRISVVPSIFIRACTGLCSGVLFPGWFAMIGDWCPVYERSRMTSVAMAGMAAGTILTYSTAGLLCLHGFDNGWGSIFYIHGAVGLVVVALWHVLTARNPDVHPRITEAERRFLQRDLHRDYRRPGGITDSPPWRQILTSGPVWSMFICHFCGNLTYYIILTCLPLFLKETLKFDIQSNGFYSALPNLSYVVGVFLIGYVADKVMSNQLLSPTTTRKFIQTTAWFGSSAFLVSSGFITCDKQEVVICLISLCTFFHAFGDGAGYGCIALDLAPRYASLIYATSNSIATLPGMVTPLIVASLAVKGTSEEWRTIFYLGGGCAVFGAIVFDLLTSANRQPWADNSVAEVCLNLTKTPLKTKTNNTHCA